MNRMDRIAATAQLVGQRLSEVLQDEAGRARFEAAVNSAIEGRLAVGAGRLRIDVPAEATVPEPVGPKEYLERSRGAPGAAR